MSRDLKGLAMPKKKTAYRVFNPEKYHMNFCHECHGLGKTLNNNGKSKEVCQACGGFGLIKKQDGGSEEKA